MNQKDKAMKEEIYMVIYNKLPNKETRVIFCESWNIVELNFNDTSRFSMLIIISMMSNTIIIRKDDDKQINEIISNPIIKFSGINKIKDERFCKEQPAESIYNWIQKELSLEVNLN